MKKALIVIVLAVVVGFFWKTGAFEPAASKAYKAHRQAVLEAHGYSRDLVAQRKWSLKIESCDTVGDTAHVRASERTATIPPNAASFAFATIVTEKLEAQLELKNGKWLVAEEKVVNRDVSTYEDRKEARDGG